MIARILAVSLLWIGVAAAEVPVPTLTSRVTDLTNTLDSGQKAALEARLEAFEREKGSQIAVLIVPTTRPEAIEQYAMRVAEAWKIGRKGVDDGVILLVAKEDRELRIEVGYGLEGALPDVIAKRIIEETIVPRFRDGDFYGGISSGIDRIIGVIEGEPLPPPERSAGGRAPSDRVVSLILFFSTAVGGIVRGLHNRFVGGLVAGALAGLVGMWLGGAAVAVLVAVLCFLLVVVMPWGGRNRGRWSSRGGSWSGGSGGGFSGGGGGFGGGGASGRW